CLRSSVPLKNCDLMLQKQLQKFRAERGSPAVDHLQVPAQKPSVRPSFFQFSGKHPQHRGNHKYIVRLHTLQTPVKILHISCDADLGSQIQSVQHRGESRKMMEGKDRQKCLKSPVINPMANPCRKSLL